MKYPSRSEYYSAIRNPQFAFRKKDPQTKIERDLDASLAMGKAVERIKLDGTKDIWSASGSFAIAFKYETSIPLKTWAIRCFYRSNFEIKTHYNRTLKRLKNNPCQKYFVDYTFLEEGIRIQGICYPILKMEWVEGENLKKFIKANLSKRNILLSLAERWREMCQNLYNAGIAHGDLQHGNVLIVKSFPQFALKLIDYDSLYFSEDRDLVDDNIKGLSDYQHPLRKSLEKRCLEIDFFPQLAIYISILALAEDKKLWETYQVDVREGLLFSRTDFLNPDMADIFKSLAQLPAPIPDLTRKMKRICQLKDFKKIPNLEAILTGEQWVESHHTNSLSQHSSSSQLLNSIVSWLKEKTPHPPLKRGTKRECLEIAKISSIESEARTEYLETQREVRSRLGVKITTLPHEAQPIQASSESSKNIGGWDPRSLKSDYIKYIKPVHSIHVKSTKISQISTQIGALAKQKAKLVLNSVSRVKDNCWKISHSVLKNLSLQLQNLKSSIVQAIASVFERLEQINQAQIKANLVVHQSKTLDQLSFQNSRGLAPVAHDGKQEKSQLSDLNCITLAPTELSIQSHSKTHQPQTNVQLQPPHPKTKTTTQVAAQLGCSLSWCHAQRYQYPDRFLCDTHYYKDAAGVVHWMEVGIEQLRCLRSQKKLSGIPANSLPTKEVSRRLGVAPEWLTKTKAKHASDFVIEVHYHTDARKRYYWTPTGIELLQQLLDEHKLLAVDSY